MPPSVTNLKFPFKTPPKGAYITPEFNRKRQYRSPSKTRWLYSFGDKL